MGICSTHRFLFPVPGVSTIFKQVMISLTCLEWIREDAESPGEAEPSEGGEGELNVGMGEGKKGLGIAQLWNSYICA